MSNLIVNTVPADGLAQLKRVSQMRACLAAHREPAGFPEQAAK